MEILNENDSSWLARDLQSMAMNMLDEIRDALAHYTDPCVIYRPRLFIDGDKWCALYGENLQDGVCGFGSSPREAMKDFNESFARNLGEARTTELFQGTLDQLFGLSVEQEAPND